jgi:phenylacetic acid degradation operon negative regulatory protein
MRQKLIALETPVQDIERMKSKTFELLSFLLWTAERLTRPTVRNLTDSYESWAYRNGLLQQLSRLEKQELLERVSAGPDDRIYRLTQQGRLVALGGRDPQAQWSRAWDGRWRIVVFDVPISRNSERQRLRRYLQERGFGFLQKSVWITPDPLREERQLIGGGKIDVKSLILLEAKPCAGESDAEIVANGWNFEEINKSYAKYFEVVNRRPQGSLTDPAVVKEFHRWAAEETQAWLSAIHLDPLLPEKLLPKDYLGRTAWQRRIAALGQASKQLKTFSKSINL